MKKKFVPRLSSTDWILFTFWHQKNSRSIIIYYCWIEGRRGRTGKNQKFKSGKDHHHPNPISHVIYFYYHYVCGIPSVTLPPTSSTRKGKGWLTKKKATVQCGMWWRFKFTWIRKKKHKSGGDAIYDHHLHQQFDFVKGFCRPIKYKMQASGSSWVSVSRLTQSFFMYFYHHFPPFMCALMALVK